MNRQIMNLAQDFILYRFGMKTKRIIEEYYDQVIDGSPKKLRGFIF